VLVGGLSWTSSTLAAPESPLADDERARGAKQNPDKPPTKLPHGARIIEPAMPLERWYQAPRKLVLLFVAVTLIPAVGLVWLTIELVEKDRSLEKQHAQERVERLADKIVAASHQRLSDLESQLHRLATAEQNAPPEHTVLLIAEGDRVTAAPAGALVYYPILPQTRQPPRGVFAEGERYEHHQGDSSKAIDWFDTLARNDDPVIRAGALLRLGRNQGKAGQIDAALATFAELEKLGATEVEGFHAGMIALEARCGILEKAGRQAELRAAAKALRSGLASGTWPLLRSAYDFYMEEARRWTGEFSETEADRNARAIAAAFQSMHERWRTDGTAPQRQWLIAEGRPVLLASAGSRERLVALVGGVDFLRDAWTDVNAVQVLLTDGEGRPILGTFPDGSAPQAVLTTDASGLPWTLRVTSTSLETGTSVAAGQRRLQLVGLTMLLLLLGGSAYFALRGVTRELTVARLQSDFVAAVSHEFRTPLASVRHLSDMLAKGRVSDAEQRQHCYDFLSRESERLEKLVEELLDFGRVEAGAYRYRFDRVEATDLVRELVSEFQENVRPKGYRIELSVEMGSALVLADREALSRAIWNLLDNAVKYSPGSDTIWVALALEGDSAVIRVRDRGLGIALSEQKEIFQKFVRGSNARIEQIKGTGIGLAMVQHIVEAHHGEVGVESHPNQGSTFALRLPIERPA
jgi:signal transduction histidine kinase